MKIDNRVVRTALIFVMFSFSFVAFSSKTSPSIEIITRPLFLIERSKNKNEVHYVARLTGDGVLDTRTPVHAFWVDWEKDPTGNKCEELNLLEKRMAFGFSVDRSCCPQSCTMKLVCCPDRPIKVSLCKGTARAETAINGQVAYLEKISVLTKEKQILPQVVSVTVFGTDTTTGAPVEETLKPH
jgi:Domain of unknown function (DUF4833)